MGTLNYIYATKYIRNTYTYAREEHKFVIKCIDADTPASARREDRFSCLTDLLESIISFPPIRPPPYVCLLKRPFSFFSKLSFSPQDIKFMHARMAVTYAKPSIPSFMTLSFHPSRTFVAPSLLVCSFVPPLLTGSIIRDHSIPTHYP